MSTDADGNIFYAYAPSNPLITAGRRVYEAGSVLFAPNLIVARVAPEEGLPWSYIPTMQDSALDWSLANGSWGHGGAVVGTAPHKDAILFKTEIAAPGFFAVHFSAEWERVTGKVVKSSAAEKNHMAHAGTLGADGSMTVAGFVFESLDLGGKTVAPLPGRGETLFVARYTQDERLIFAPTRTTHSNQVRMSEARDGSLVLAYDIEAGSAIEVLDARGVSRWIHKVADRPVVAFAGSSVVLAFTDGDRSRASLFDRNGHLERTQDLGGARIDPHAIVVNDSGDVWLAGRFKGELSCDGSSIQNSAAPVEFVGAIRMRGGGCRVSLVSERAPTWLVPMTMAPLARGAILSTPHEGDLTPLGIRERAAHVNGCAIIDLPSVADFVAAKKVP